MRITSSLGFVVALGLSSFAFAQSGVDLMVRPFPKDSLVEARGEAFALDDPHFKQTGEDMSLNIFDAEARYRIKPGERVDPRVGFDFTQINTSGADQVPKHMTDTAIAFGMGVLDQSGWIGGASIGIGYSSANAFNDANALYAKFDLALGKTIDENQEFGLVIDFDGNRSEYRDIPLPGFVYRLRLPDRKLYVVAGFPYSSVEWRPDDKWTLEARWSYPDDVGLFINYKVAKELGVFGSLRRRVETFNWNELSDSTDRLFFEQRRGEVGVSWEPVERLRGELAIGYAFAQEFSTGYNFSNTDLIGDVSDAPYLRLGVQWQY